ncbi:MAG TPA: glycosyltransferase family 39 protein, partial [Candidatus Hydrogenedentes bacterium]|nr:glycosyltransferase family 39 protein [Candidatus Hydrogenedentota bacterium]
QFLDPWPALFAVFVISFTPSVFHASRFFMTDYPAATVTVWSFYALLRSDRFRNIGWVALFGVLTGLGILTRTVTFVYYILPAAVVFALGLWASWRQSDRPSADRVGPSRLLLHGVIAVGLSVAVFAPWYFHNLEIYYNYWVNQHAGGTGGPLTIARPNVPVTPRAAPPAAEASPEQPTADETTPVSTAVEIRLDRPQPPPVPARVTWADRLRGMLERRQPWTRYLAHVVNNNLFLPLSLLAAAGAVLALVMRRFRSFTTVLMLLWLLGAYVLMTVLIKYSVARYALPVAPALALLAALPVIALPRRSLRAAAMAALGAYLLFGYCNLTFASYGPLGRLYVPVILNATIQNSYQDPGLAVYKDTITYGYSYSGLGAAVRETYRADDDYCTIHQCNYQDRLLRAMAREDRRRRVLTGEYANYMRLGREMRGMELAERHFWPPPNPFLDRSLRPEDIPARRLRSIQMALSTKELPGKLPQTDYVAYAVYASDKAQEREWQQFLKERGFELVERFTIERFGYVPARTYGVMSRKETAVITIESKDDIDRLGLFELYDLRASHQFPQLRVDMREYTLKRFLQLLEQGNYPPPQEINEYLTYIGAEVARIHDNEFRFWFIFRVHKPIQENLRVFLHGRVTTENLHFLEDSKRSQGYQDWNFDPEPPITDWPAGDYVIITRTIMPAPIPYTFKLGFFTSADGDFGRGVNVGTVDFGLYQ